jgi:hypothetical protein
MGKEINSEGSFLGFKYNLLAFFGYSFVFFFYFKKVELIGIYYVKGGRESRPAFMFSLFGKKVVTNVYFKNGKNGELDQSGKYKFFGG